MPTSESELKIIAEAIHTIANTPDYRWISVLISVLVGFFLSEIKGLLTNRLKQRTILSILNLEIRKRWNKGIGRALKKGVEQGKSREPADLTSWLDAFADRQYNPQDLFVIDRISNSMQEFFFLDNALLSNIVYAHVLTKDLHDCHRYLRDLRPKIKEKQSLSGGLDQTTIEEISKHYNYFSTIVGRIDEVLGKDIFPSIASYRNDKDQEDSK